LFENFVTEDGDFLTAKFRAFKFPDSSYVQFRGTVNVCLDKCKGVECSNGQIGYGKRKRREVTSAPDANKLFEIDLSTFIKVDYEGKPDTRVITETEESLKNLKIANQKLNRNSRENVFESIHDTRPENLNTDTAKVEETSVFTKVIEKFETSGSICLKASNFALTALVISIILKHFM
jgi:hypothetical protein